MKTILSVYIAGRRRVCEHVDGSTMTRGLNAIKNVIPELELQGRVVVTGERDGIVYIIPLQQKEFA